MANLNKSRVPTITPGPSYLKVEDFEPLSDDPNDPSSTEPMELECHLNQINTSPLRYHFAATIDSNSSNGASVNYTASDNTINIVLNDVGAGNGSAFTLALDYDAATGTDVFVEAKKNSKKVGKAKHKIDYGTI